jgi:hypothetical protein
MEDIKRGFEHLYSIVDDDLRINVKQVEKVIISKVEQLEMENQKLKQRGDEAIQEGGRLWSIIYNAKVELDKL